MIAIVNLVVSSVFSSGKRKYKCRNCDVAITSKSNGRNSLRCS